MKDRPLVLLGATLWWPLSARLASALIHHGCRVSAVCPGGHPLRFVSGVEHIYPYRGLSSSQSLKSAIAQCQPDVVVPCDDGIVLQLHSFHERFPEIRALIEYSLGAPEMYPAIQRRGTLLEEAAKLGIRTPVTETLTCEADLEKWRPAIATVLKADGTWGGSGVEIAHTYSDAISAYRRLSQPQGAGVAWKRLLVNRDPLALWLWRNRKTPSITAQQYIAGCPANAMFVSWKGEVLACVTVKVIAAQGATGAATVVRLIQNAEISQAAQLLARQFMLSGFHGLDFILEEGTGAAYLIEMNPRCTQLGHLRVEGQGDLAGIFSAALKGVDPPQPDDCITAETIAFFPQAFSWNPQSPYLHSGYHDVPWEEPRLFRELLREQWPDRQLLARIYHSFRPPRKPREVQFEGVSHSEPDQRPADEAAFADHR
jgi:hypothetical protein